MANNQVSREKQKKLESARKDRKPYQKPAFRHERVFETLALACGKVSAIQASCQFSRKNS